VADLDKVPKQYREFNVRHFHEKLQDLHFSDTSVKTAQQ
jgi:hypothetical protein